MINSARNSKTHAANPIVRLFFVALSVAVWPTVRADAIDWTQYKYSFNIKFSGYRGATTLIDFPVLVRLSPSLNEFKYRACMVANGGDLRFSDALGNLLVSEVDTWNENGASLVWVKVPALNATTVITAHYGCANPAPITASDVWSNGYLGVWHMGETSGSMLDATGRGLDFVEDSDLTPGTVNAAQEGVIGRSVLFGCGTGGNELKGGLKATSSSPLLTGGSAATVELWTYQDDHDPSSTTRKVTLLSELTADGAGSYPNIWNLYEANTSGSQGKTVFTFYTGSAGSQKYASPSSTAPLAPRAEWNHHAGVFGGSAGAAVFLNGDRTGTNSAAQDNLRSSLGADTLYLGNMSLSADQVFKGRIDEVRISNVARSDDWIQASHDTVKNNAVFTSYSPVKDRTVRGLMVVVQ